MSVMKATLRAAEKRHVERAERTERSERRWPLLWTILAGGAVSIALWAVILVVGAALAGAAWIALLFGAAKLLGAAQ